MSRPTGFADLAGRRVGIWGFGIEGHATLDRIRDLVSDVVVVDDEAKNDPAVLRSDDGGFNELLTCDVVIKSPGISRYRPDVLALREAGVEVTSALELWMSDVDRTRVIAVTGTKGKSTTTSLITYFLCALGLEARSAGNIGVAPYDPQFVNRGWTVLEVSSFQSVELSRAPGIVVVTALGADHLDWHGTLEQYHADKLAITRAAGEHVTFVTTDVLESSASTLLGGDVRVVSSRDDELAHSLGLLGAHNAVNVQLALEATARATALEVHVVRERVLQSPIAFEPLPGRLTLVRTLNGRRYVDDGLATAPLPTVAALAVFADDAVALIVGGFDRGVDYSPLGDAIALRHAPTTLIAMPDAGTRIARVVAERSNVTVMEVATMSDAVLESRRALDQGGVVLLSPGAPSFGQYANWRERSAEFATIVNSLSD